MPQVALFTIGTYVVTVGTVIQVALVVASVAYSRQQSKKLKNSLKRLGDVSAEATERMTTSRDPVAPRRMVYGECRVGGTVIFNHNNGVNNQFKHLVVNMADHEVEGFANLQFDDEVVLLDGAGNALGRFAGYVTAHFFLGSPSQAVNAALIANCPEIIESTDRMRGSAGVYVEFVYNADLFPNGVPNVTAVCKGKKLYDPRTDLRVWSNNAALVQNDYMTDVYLGMGIDYDSEMHDAELIASANNCDELVELEDGTFEKRYTINCMITTDTVHQDVLDDMAEAMAGMYTYVSGRFSIISGYYRTPTLPAFDETALRDPLEVQTKPSRADNFNAVKGTFISPANYWQAAEFPPIKNSTYKTQDNNELIWKDVAYPFTTSAATCQRLAKIKLEEIRQGITVVVKGNLKFMSCQCGDVIKITNADFGWTDKHFKVVDWELADDAQHGLVVDLVLRETAAGVYDWADGEETVGDLAPNTNLPSPYAIQPPTDVVAVSDGSTIETVGSESLNRMLVSWTSPADAVVVSGGYIRIQYRAVGTVTWRDWGLHEGSKTEEYIYPVLTGLVYVARLRSENRGLGIVSPWVYSDPTEATGDTTPPAVPTSLTATGGIGGIYLGWTNPTDADFDRIEIYEYTANTPAPGPTPTILATVNVSDPYPETYFRSGLTGGDSRWYWIRSVDESGNKSAWVGPQGATAASELNATAVPESAYGTGSDTPTNIITTNSVTAVPVGGVPSFTYLWSFVSGDEAYSQMVSGTNTASSRAWSFFVVGSGTYTVTEVWKCQVSDSAGTVVYTQEVPITIEVIESGS